jgi:hypothetical protein
MPLKDAMRSREVSKRWRLAEREDGEAPEARFALRERLPLAYLPCYVSQASLQPHVAGVKTDAEYRSASAEGGLDQPAYPLPALGSHRAWLGPRGTCHLRYLVGVRHGEHGRAGKGWEGEGRVGRGDPPRKLRGPPGSQMGHRSRSVGKPQAWRRPSGLGSGNGTKVPRERARCPPWTW